MQEPASGRGEVKNVPADGEQKYPIKKDWRMEGETPFCHGEGKTRVDQGADTGVGQDLQVIK